MSVVAAMIAITASASASAQPTTPMPRRNAKLATARITAASASCARTVGVGGTTAEFMPLRKIHLRMGRYLPAGDDERGERVCVIGSKLQDELFLGRNPLGETLRLGEELLHPGSARSRRGPGQDADRGGEGGNR